MWFDESVFYQIYPLGYCGAERENDFGEVRHRLARIEEQIPYIRDCGFNAVLFNPLFESERHGYDTVDFFRIDRRLGDNEDLKRLVAKFHEAGIRVVLDGVFNHVGRRFFAFEEVREKRENSDKKDWFHINFGGNTAYNDGFWYEGWEGHMELVKLNLQNEAVLGYIGRAVEYWMDEFGIDGLRLDVSYLLPEWFFEWLRRIVRGRRDDFFLMGEVIHNQNFQKNLTRDRLDSITNYECYKGLTSALNSDNLFEIEHSLERLFGSQPWCLYTGKNLFSFVDNHDVPRACTALKDRRKLPAMYGILYGMPGIPCVYYGSECGAEGDKSDNDYKLRPAVGEIDKDKDPALRALIGKLNAVRKAEPALQYGTYEKCVLSNKYMCFKREKGGDRIYCAYNISDGDVTVRVEEAEGTDLLTGEVRNLNDIYLPPFAVKLFKKNH
ncbi:MAG TPA: cyclomaltodextrinase [Candidatus Borkfalkia faecigallinarum]|uniref:Cyclomaltodextrinase n=1 Tax=Candidatus Borkfalkia faecigallinarum TaxID=2838509 RepID=A0A9D2AQJ7_9FIRM|nr:cyclomaltodextrinase [Candidatus Borkfalkia faecigallinarum]